METIEIFFIKISCLLYPPNVDLMKLISKDRQERLAKFKFGIDCKLSLYSELLVRHYICKEIGLSNQDIIFKKNENGKPSLLSHSEIQFNISHTRNAIVVAFSNEEIGIDIEKIRSTDLKIARRFFTPSELDYILYNENPERAFYEIWTKKEAYIKYIGTGLSMALKSFNVLDEKLNSMIYTFEAEQYLISTCCRKLLNTRPIIRYMTESQLRTLFDEIMQT